MASNIKDALVYRNVPIWSSVYNERRCDRSLKMVAARNEMQYVIYFLKMMHIPDIIM